MKTAKRKPGKTRGAAKAGDEADAVRKYIASAPAPAKSKLKEMRAVIRSVLPQGASEAISYRIPAFRLGGIVVWYAGFAKHCSLFPTAAVVKRLEKELGGYAKSKGTIQFALDKALPAALIRKIVKERLAQMGRREKT